MSVETVGIRLMVFLSEDDRLGHHGLHEVLLNRAREDGIAGATVWRGIEGFGASGHLRTARFPDANLGLPLALEVIDLPERIEAFLPTILELAPHSFVTKEQILVRRFGEAIEPNLDEERPEKSQRS